MNTNHDDPLPSPNHRGQIHRLTDPGVAKWIRQNIPLLEDKILWLPDGGNLFLALNPGGAATWFAFVPHNKSTRQCQVGVYPDKLAHVREQANRARQIAAQGQNPNTHKRVQRERNAAEARAFEEVADGWIADAQALWKPNTRQSKVGMLKNYFARESFYRAPLRDLTTAQAHDFYEKVAETSEHVAVHCMKVMRGIVSFAKSKNFPHDHGLASVASPTNLKAYRGGGRASRGRMPAFTDLREIAKIFRKERSVESSWQVKGIHRACALTAQRIGPVTSMKWAHLDLERGVWSCPREGMKKDPKIINALQKANPKRINKTWMDHYHDVPLSTQAIELFKGLARVNEWVFPSPITPEQHARPNSVTQHLKRKLDLEGKHVPHGYRTTFTSWREFHVGEDGKPVFHKDIVRRILDHEVRTADEMPYSRAANFELLRPCMQAYCDDLEAAEQQLALELDAEH